MRSVDIVSQIKTDVDSLNLPNETIKIVYDKLGSFETIKLCSEGIDDVIRYNNKYFNIGFTYNQYFIHLITYENKNGVISTVMNDINDIIKNNLIEVFQIGDYGGEATLTNITYDDIIKQRLIDNIGDII